MLSLLHHNNVPEKKFDTNRTLFRGWGKKVGERTSIHVSCQEPIIPTNQITPDKFSIHYFNMFRRLNCTTIYHQIVREKISQIDLLGNFNMHIHWSTYLGNHTHSQVTQLVEAVPLIFSLIYVSVKKVRTFSSYNVCILHVLVRWRPVSGSYLLRETFLYPLHRRDRQRTQLRGTLTEVSVHDLWGLSSPRHVWEWDHVPAILIPRPLSWWL